LNKTILALSTAQIQSQIRLHVGLATLDPIPQLAARLQLGSAQLSLARGWWRGWWVLLCWRVNWPVANMACQLCMLTSQLCHADVILIRVSLVGWIIWYSGRVYHSGEEDAWPACGALVHMGNLLSSACWRMRACLALEFCTVFTSGFVSSSSTQWYGQNIILTTFIFEQKSNTTLNYKLWYQFVGGRNH